MYESKHFELHLDEIIEATYYGSEDDIAFTTNFLNAWHEEIKHSIPSYYAKLEDVNYATDEKDPKTGKRKPHFVVGARYGEGILSVKSYHIRKEILPYDWYNPESGEIEPGFIRIEVGIRFGVEHDENARRAKLTHAAERLEFHYNHSIEDNYEGSRNTITEENLEAKRTVEWYNENISLLDVREGILPMKDPENPET